MAAVVAILIVTSMAQSGISYTIAFGDLQGLVPTERTPAAALLIALRFGLIAFMVVLWTLKWKRGLFRSIILANAIFTFVLIIHTHALMAVLFGLKPEAIKSLIIDVTLMSASNILIFSVWYWVIDPPGVDDIPRDNERWDFLFPQRASRLPNYETWMPRYGDYLFVAFTTSFAFSPTDTMPLSIRAKLLMLLQSVISVATLTGIAGSVINILGG